MAVKGEVAEVAEQNGRVGYAVCKRGGPALRTDLGRTLFAASQRRVVAVVQFMRRSSGFGGKRGA